MAQVHTVKCDLCSWTYTGVDAKVTYRTHLRTEHSITAPLPAGQQTLHQDQHRQGLTDQDRRMLKEARIATEGL